MKDDREFADSEGRTWRVTLRSHAPSGAAAEGAKMPRGYFVLRFQSDREVRLAPAGDDWEQLPDERLRAILETEAVPESAWRAGTPATTNDDEGLHGISDAPGG